MRLEFDEGPSQYVNTFFTDAADFQARVACNDGEFIHVGIEGYCAKLTRGMAYALHSAIETWLDTGELPKYVECTDDPPRRGDPFDRFHKPCGHDVAAGCDCAENEG